MVLDGVDLVLIARAACREAGSKDTRAELERLCKLAGLWRDASEGHTAPEAM